MLIECHIIQRKNEESHVHVATKSTVRKLITAYHWDSAVITRVSPMQTISATKVVAISVAVLYYRVIWFFGPEKSSNIINGTPRNTVIENEWRAACITFHACRDARLNREARVSHASLANLKNTYIREKIAIACTEKTRRPEIHANIWTRH